MTLSLPLAQKIVRLMRDEALPYSQLKSEKIERMIEEGVLVLQSSGTRKKVYCRDIVQLQCYLKNHFGIADIAQFVTVPQQEDFHRFDAVRISSDSKIKAVRTFTGFLANCYQPVAATLNDVVLDIFPPPGTLTYIYDFKNFIPAADTVIIGVENGENFRYVEQQKHLFNGIKALFVSRYPPSGDLIQWLRGIPNPYLHYGDFDFSGINIYLNEFKCHLGHRAQFFVPQQIAALMRRYGNRELYQRQLHLAPAKESLPESELEMLWDLICAEKKGLEQEILINAALV